MIPDLREGIVARIKEYLDWVGIDPFYAVTIFAIILAFSYRKDFKMWDEIPFWEKSIVVATFFAAIVFSLMSLLRLFGVIRW